jgi:hypothetical protein
VGQWFSSYCLITSVLNVSGVETLRNLQLVTWSGSFLPFMKSEGSLPCSHDLVTGPYSEPDESIPHTLSLKTNFNIIFQTEVVFPLRYPTKMLLLISSSNSCYMSHQSYPLI